MAQDDRIKEITANLEQGVAELFKSEKYAAYLQTMSRFHNYSSRNIMLIHMQKPDASRVASFLSWKNNFNRYVKKGEHGIKIFAPIASRKKDDDIEVERIDPVTKQPVLDEKGQPVMERLSPLSGLQSMRFKVVTVFDASQTEGDPLPELAETLNGSVERYDLFMDALRAVSPLPIVFEPMDGDQDGYCAFGDKIGIREGMSEVQTVCAVVHELTHAKLHDKNNLAENAEPKDRRAEECEAESCAFSTLSYFGIDTGANSFGYLLEWAKTRELKELKASLDTIRKTTAELINGIDENYRALAKERGIDLSVIADELGAEANYNMIDGVINNAPPTDAEQQTAIEPPMVTEQAQSEESSAQAEAEQPAALAVLAEYERHAAVRDPRTVGETVLMTLLFDGGNLNRTGKRSRVKVEPPIGKYELFSRDEGTPPNTTNYLYAMTASGKLALLGESERLKDLTEARLDGHIRLLAESFEKQLASPTEWADFAAAAFLNRIDEAEAHNVPVRELREAESQARRDVQREREKRLAAEKQESFDARVNEIAKAIESGVTIKVGYDDRENGGKNPVLYLFRLYGVELPLRTQGWVNTTLAAITPEGYSRYTKIGGKKRGESERFGERLAKLKQAVKQTPIEQKRGIANDNPTHNTEVKRTLEHDLYQKFAEMFPDFMDRKYSYLRLESPGYEPLSLEWIDDRISVMHTYTMNGDLMYDPMIEFSVNSAEKTMRGVTFEQSMPPLYQFYDVDGVGQSVDGNGNRRETPNLSAKLNDFAKQWFENIGKQGFMPVRAAMDINGDDVRIDFDADGKPIMPDAPKAAEKTIEHNLYEKFAEMFPDFMEQKYSKVTLQAEHAKPLELEWVFGDTLSIAHTYELNGKPAFEPLVMLKADSVNKTLAASSLELSEPPRRDIVYSGEGRVDRAMQENINNFMAQWLDRAEKQRFRPVEATLWNEGRIKEVDVIVTFGKDGNAIMPEPEKPGKRYELDYGFLGVGITVWNRAEEVNGECPTVAYISPEREVTVYDKDMPREIIDTIDRTAKSPDTWAFGFAPALDPLPQKETPKQNTLDLSLPDPTVTAAAMNEYGYTEPDMYPLSAERAVELFDTDHTIYLLYPDNTEAIALDRDEIITFSSGGLCGITKTDWETSPVRDAQNKVYEGAIQNRGQTEASLEADLLYGDNPYYRENKYGIYQIKDDLPEARNFRSAPMKELEAHGLTVSRDNYALVYVGDLPGRVEFLRDKTTALNSLFEKFNIDHPADYTGRSMSAGDVVVLRCNGDITAHYVDSVGFAELPSFTGNEREQPQTLSQIGTKPPSVAELESDVKSGKTVSIMDLAQATHNERQKPVTKGKPSILSDLEEFRKIAGSGGRQDNKKTERGHEQ